MMHFSHVSKSLKIRSWWESDYRTCCGSRRVASTSLLLWNMPKWGKCMYVHGDCFEIWYFIRI